MEIPELGPRNVLIGTNESGKTQLLKELAARERPVPVPIYRFERSDENAPMRRWHEVADNERLRADGANIGAVLARIRRKQPDAFEMIHKVVALVHGGRRHADPVLDDGATAESGRARLRHAGDASGGALRMVALTTLLNVPDAGADPLLLDEPEQSLHPRALNLIGAMIRSASEDRRIVVATQSPLLVDEFSPEDIIVAASGEDGPTYSRIDGKRLKPWLEDYSLGQLWQKNEIGGNEKSQ